MSLTFNASTWQFTVTWAATMNNTGELVYWHIINDRGQTTTIWTFMGPFGSSTVMYEPPPGVRTVTVSAAMESRPAHTGVFRLRRPSRRMSHPFHVLR